MNQNAGSTQIDSYSAGSHAKISRPLSQTSSSSSSEYPGYLDHYSADSGWEPTPYTDSMIEKMQRFPRVKNSRNSHEDFESDRLKHSGDISRVSGDDSATTPGLELNHVAAEVTVDEHRNSKHDTRARLLFCTWPDCDSRFRYRFDWSRHEEAVHYVPYHWICCMTETFETVPPCFLCVGSYHTTTDHCSSCRGKEIGSRTFYREDQLVQHIKRIHRYKGATIGSIPKVLLALWKCDNPSISAAGLHCGFCGESFGCWAERQDHVFEHLVKGVCKSSWLPIIQAELSLTIFG